MTIPNSPGKGAAKESKDGSSSNKKGKNWQQRPGKPSMTPRQTKFERKCNDLNGHIYDCYDSRQANQCIKTTKQIQDYVGRTFKGGGDERLIFDNLTLPVIPEPDNLPKEATLTKHRIWEKEVDQYVKQVAVGY
jgi:hypothetical protein